MDYNFIDQVWTVIPKTKETITTLNQELRNGEYTFLMDEVQLIRSSVERVVYLGETHKDALTKEIANRYYERMDFLASAEVAAMHEDRWF